MESVIGINLGTSFCTASLINTETGEPKPIAFQENAVGLPSVVFFPKGGKPVVGFEPYHQLERLAKMPENQREYILQHTIQDMKWRMNAKGCFHFEERDYTHVEVIAEILKSVRAEAMRISSVSGDITDVVLTYPVDFSEWQKDMYRQAGLLAGFKNVTLLEEPVAATIGYLQSHHVNNASGVVVYDFGTFKFNAAYVQIDRQADGCEYHIAQTPRYEDLCGGRNIDIILYQNWDRLAQNNYHHPIAKAEGEFDLEFLLRCRRQKELLSKVDSISQNEMMPSQDGNTSQVLEMMLTRVDFNGMIEKIIDKTLKETTELVNDVHAAALPIDYVLMTGGSSRIPLVEEKLRAAFPDLKIVSERETETSTAIGALYFLKMQSNEKTEYEPSYQAPQNDEKEPTTDDSSQSIVGRLKTTIGQTLGKIPLPSQNKVKPCECYYCKKKISVANKFCLYCGKSNIHYQNESD